MNLYDSIMRRKSCRKYDMQPLEKELLDEIKNAIKGFEPLYPDVPVEYRFTNRVKGSFHINAPHYLIISGNGAPGEGENTGFLFEQLVLWFDAMELGSVWLGSSKDAETKDAGRDIIAIAFGHVTEPVHRTRQQFKRKQINAVTNAPDDGCIKAVHIAPSGMNMQPWYFEKEGEQVRVYKQKLKPPVSLMYKHTDIDMGIALCHYALACKEAGKPFHFYRNITMPDRPGYVPFGMIGQQQL